MVSKDMSDFFYRKAQAMHDSDEGGIVVGTTPISMSAILWASGLFLVWHLLAWAWILSGGTVWKGYKETAVKAHVGWSATPLSSLMLDRGFAVNPPFLGRAGEELVVSYVHDSDFIPWAGAYPVRVSAYCFLGCTANDSSAMVIEAAGKGELTVVLPKTSLYTVRIEQLANRDGSVSRGTFWWGTRAQRPTPEAN
jgi:hypothetical protein